MGQEDKTNEWSGEFVLPLSSFSPSFAFFNCLSYSSVLSPLSSPLFFLSVCFFISLSLSLTGTSDLSSSDLLSITHWCAASTALLISDISIKSSLFTLDLSLETFTFIYLYISHPVSNNVSLLPDHAASILLQMLSSFPHQLQPSSLTAPPPFFSALLLLSFWPWYLFCLSSPSADFNHFFPLLPYLPFLPLPLHCISLSTLLSSCPPILLLFLHSCSPLLTLHKSPYSFLFPFYFFIPVFWRSELVSFIYSVMFYGLGLSQPQQACDNNHHTHPTSGLKEIYRAIMQWQPHWRFTTAKSTGVNTP